MYLLEETTGPILVCLKVLSIKPHTVWEMSSCNPYFVSNGHM